MRNPVTATPDPTARDIAHPPFGGPYELGGSRFGPLFSRSAELVMTAVDDELGRPLVGVFVPDGELL